MPELQLIKPAMKHKQQYEEMMDKWIAFGGRINPGALRHRGLSYEEWLSIIEKGRHHKTCSPGNVPQDIYFLINNHKILGAVAIRPLLDRSFLETGGHIGYGIRPSQRGKGYGKRQLALALEKCRGHYHLDRVLVTCDKDNPASAAVILANDGVFENKVVEEDGNIVSRYWINLE